jgi:hypothetical protein
MTLDPKFNPYRKQAQEQGSKEGWDFSGFMSRPEPDEVDKNAQVAKSLQTILEKAKPTLPHAPEFSQYLLDSLGQDLRYKKVRTDVIIDKRFKVNSWDVIHQGECIGQYATYARLDGAVYANLFEGTLEGMFVKLRFQKQRKDEYDHIPFP